MGGLLLLFSLVGVFIAYFAYGWNYLMAVDNAEHLAVDFSPWWQQIRYYLYLLITLIPASFVYFIIGRLFSVETLPSITKISISIVFFFVIFVSGIAGTASGRSKS